MELLTVRHKDFTMSIECSKFDAIWNKASNNVSEADLTSTYSWSEGVQSVVRQNEEGVAQVLEQGQSGPAVFFDNAEYTIWVEFGSHVNKACFGSQLQRENENFGFRKGVLAGFLNYYNDIGKSEININYYVGAEQRHFTFSFEVLSTKLNYHEHWRKIIQDIEDEYRMLSLDYLRRTFHGFDDDPQGDTPDLIWWSIFKAEQGKFIKAVKSIIERPRHRLHGVETYLRADKLTRVPANIENDLAEHRKESAHLYRVEQQAQSNDTQENRFLKHALGQIASRYEMLKKRLDYLPNIAEGERKEMQAMLDTLKHLKRNPFFRTVGPFKGLNQENMVLQKATCYSQVYRTWNLLHRAYSLNDGRYRLQTKDIATLYEIWCYIEVSHIVKELLGDDVEVDNKSRAELNGIFTFELSKGENSRILFKKDNVELAELVYNPKHNGQENDSLKIENIVAPTAAQKPDIVLQLTKRDLQNDMKLTYLFDAKYRIDGRVNGVDTPPEDAINQMHRYRDAIYYKEKGSKTLKKEVIGGYILFPGDGERTDVEVAKFYKTIGEVNIGAFPLRPKDHENRKLLVDFIKMLIDKKALDEVSAVIPQKGTKLVVPHRALIGLVRSCGGKKGYKESFENRSASLYYTGPYFPSTITLQDLHFFVPYIKGKGIRDLYKITRLRTITSSEVKEDGNPNDIRLAFELEYVRPLYEDYKMVDTSHFSNYTFLATNIDELDGLESDEYAQLDLE